MKFIDLTRSLSTSTPVFDGYPKVSTVPLDSTSRSTPQKRHLNSTLLTIGLHCGTHLDAPFHFYGDGKTIENIALEQCAGPCLMIDLRAACETGRIEAEDILPWQEKISRVRKVILRTGWESHWGQASYFSEHPVMTGSAASLLVSSGVELVGVDIPSVDREPFEAHLELLQHNVLILENLAQLDAVPVEQFQLFAFPLKIEGREASPVRAIALVE